MGFSLVSQQSKPTVALDRRHKVVAASATLGGSLRRCRREHLVGPLWDGLGAGVLGGDADRLGWRAKAWGSPPCSWTHLPGRCCEEPSKARSWPPPLQPSGCGFPGVGGGWLSSVYGRESQWLLSSDHPAGQALTAPQTSLRAISLEWTHVAETGVSPLGGSGRS